MANLPNRSSPGFELYPSWDEVLSAARSGYSLWYWGAMDTKPHRVHVVKVFANGKIRCDPMNNQADAFTLNPDHHRAGLVYRKAI